MSILGVRMPAEGFGFAFVAALVIAGDVRTVSAAPLIDCPKGTTYAEAAVGYERATWCARADAKREGPWVVWWDTKRKKEDGDYSAGERNGLWRTWFADGKAQSEGLYARGVRTGTWKTWHSNGGLEQVATYVNGVPDGPWTTWYRSGNKAEEGRMTSGVKTGSWSTWYENGKKASEGTWKASSSTWIPVPTAKKFAPGPIDTTQEDGRWSYWYPNGQKQAEGSFKFGCRHGGWSEWDESGRAELVVWKDCLPVE